LTCSFQSSSLVIDQHEQQEHTQLDSTITTTIIHCLIEKKNVVLGK
jgi:hypothetical protein